MSTCDVGQLGNIGNQAVRLPLRVDLLHFWASLKKEQVHQQHYQTRAQAQSDIFSYIETFYNTTRLHSALGNKSPAQFQTEYWQRQNSTEPQAQWKSLPPAPPSSLKQFNEDQSVNVAALH